MRYILKHHYIEKGIKRPEFSFKNRKRIRGAKLKQKGSPSLSWKLTCLSEPLDFINLMIIEKFREDVMLNFTNQRAAMEREGRAVYSDYKSFKICELNAYLGLLIANGIVL